MSELECAESSLEERSRERDEPRVGNHPLDLADGLTSTVVVARVPLGLSVSNTASDVSLALHDDLEDLELPIGVGLGSLDGVRLVVVHVVDGGVLVGLASLDAVLGLRDELLDGVLDLSPVLGLEGSDEGIGGVSDLLVLTEAGLHVGLDIDTVVSHEETGLEVSGGNGGHVTIGGLDGESGQSEHLLF